MIRGSCLCGKVKYEVSGALSHVTHCHCSRCRKAHGAAFGTYARVKADDFRFVEGESVVSKYASSEGVVRTFCGNCGATLQFISAKRPATFALAIGTLDDDPRVRPEMHIFVGSKAPWVEIHDGLPQLQAYK
jgi:hypothetical protein